MKFRKSRCKKCKKADLSLSVNSIVILIIAITVLGLGLTFVRGLFSKATSKVSQAIELGDLTNPPNSNDPLTVTPKELELRQGKKDTIAVNFMNSLGSNMYCKLVREDITPDVSLTPTLKSECKVPPRITLNEKCYKYNKDQVNQYSLGVEGRGVVISGYPSSCSFVQARQTVTDASEGTWVFTLKVACFADEQKCNSYTSGSAAAEKNVLGLATKDFVLNIVS